MNPYRRLESWLAESYWRVLLAWCVPLAILLLLCLLSGCVPSLKVHERMGKLSQAARAACEAKADRCAAALLCHTAADNAGQALQAARQAIAEGKDDPEAAVKAAALPEAADAVCKVAKVSP